MKIAVVDDDPIFHFIIKKSLALIAPDHELLRFDNGQEAFDAIRNNQNAPETLPDLILLDINMPLMNGWQFLDNLRNLRVADFQPSIYIVSSSSTQSDILKAQTYAELKGYLTKPLSKQQITNLLKNENNT